MSEVEALKVRITGDNSDLKKSLGDSAKAAAKFAAAAAAAGTAVTAALVKRSLSAIDAQAKLAQSLGTTSQSMGVLERAGDLSGVSFDKLRQASSDLQRRLSRASAVGGPVADALARIGLSANELQSIPLDERIQKINTALTENASSFDRAAIAGQLFGDEGSLAMQRISSGAIDEARKQAELFGTAISDIDAAKVEQANDAMSAIGVAIDGAAKQFTIALAPVLKAIGDQFLGIAEEAGGMQAGVQKAFDFVINGAAFVMNAVDGIKRVFVAVADGVIAAWSGMISAVTGAFAGLIEKLNSAAQVFGVDLFEGPAKSLREFSDMSAGVMREALGNIGAELERPLSGDKFKQFVASAQEAGQAAAEAAATAGDAVGDAAGNKSGPPADLAGIQDRLAGLREANATELELIQQKFIDENNAVREGLANKLIAEQEAQELSAGAAQRFADAKLEIEKKRVDSELAMERQKEDAKRAILSQAFGGLSSLMNSESKKLFKIGKTAAIAQATISTFTGMAKALELGWPLGPIAAAAIGLNGFAKVASIKKQSFGGGATGAGGASATQQINANNTPTNNGGGQDRNLFVSFQGINPDSLVRAGSVTDVLNNEIDNGAQIRGLAFA